MISPVGCSIVQNMFEYHILTFDFLAGSRIIVIFSAGTVLYFNSKCPAISTFPFGPRLCFAGATVAGSAFHFSLLRLSA